MVTEDRIDNVHFLLHVFSNDVLLSAYFIFTLYYKNDARQKANLSEFAEFKMAHKAAETSYNIIRPKNC